MPEMEYVKLPYVELPVSKIFLGTAMPPLIMGEDGNELLDRIFETGVNTFDTARNYLYAEKSLGKWISERNMREKIVILSKCGHPGADGKSRLNAAEIRKDFATSTELLNTDYIDIYLAHRDDTETFAGLIVEIFNAMHAEGKIGAFGVSNWTHERIGEANEYAYKHQMIPLTVSSPNFGLAQQYQDPWGGGCVSISGPEGQDARTWYEKNQMPVIAYSSLGRGLFSGKIKSNALANAGQFMDAVAMKGYAGEENFERLRRCEKLAAFKGCTVPQIAMAWIFGQKLQTFAIVSTKSALRMQENIDALHLKLSEDELLYLDLRKETL